MEVLKEDTALGQIDDMPFSRREWMVAGGGMFAGIALGCGCHSAPMTGRPQLLMMRRGQELTLGAEAFDQTLQEQPRSANEAAASIVRRVGQRIAAVSGAEGFEWRFELLESMQQNAFCLPGGKVAVYEGILPVCQSEAGLAVVMSHEVAHAIARHGSERMSHGMVADSVKQGVDLLVQHKIPDRRELVLAAYGAAAEYGVIRPYSRKHESEADQIGIMMMADAGYDPAEAPRFWSRFGQLKSGSQQPPEFLSTHPSDERRSQDLEGLLPEAQQRFAKCRETIGMGETIPV